MVANIDTILNSLQRVKPLASGGFMAICPAHKDVNASLSIAQDGDKILMKCMAGCPTTNVVKALNLTMADLFIGNKPRTYTPSQPKGKIVAEYDYKDESGKTIYQVVRLDPKSFLQRHRNGGGEWVWSMEGVTKIPYHLPEVVRCFDDTLYHVEGEKDADALMNWGKVATTTPGGANGWRVDYAKYYMGKKVVIIPDNDTAGHAYAKDIIRSLIGKARDIKVILLPEKTKDISDWLNAGNDIENLVTMEQNISVLLNPDKPNYQMDDGAISWNKMVGDRLITFTAENLGMERTGIHAKTSISCDYDSMAWGYFNIERSEDRKRISNQAYKQLKNEKKHAELIKIYTESDMNHDFDLFCAGLWEFQLRQFVPELMHGDPVQQPITFMLNPYIIQGGGTILFAPPGRGKSYTALMWAISVDAGVTSFWPVRQNKILFINLERSRDSLRRRVAMVNRVLNLPPTRPILTLNARGKSLNDVLPVCRKYIKEYGVKCVVLDSISRAGYGDLNENQPMNKIIDALSSLSETWLALSHTSRANEEHAFGSIMLDAGADVCVQLVTQVKEDGTLGLGYQITKQNDIGCYNMNIYALEFDECGLTNVRKAKCYEFIDIEGKSKKEPETIVMDYILNMDEGCATATEISAATGINRSTISRMLNQTNKFVVVKKDKQNVFYGVKSNV